jgi:adenylate cyclase
MSAVIDSFRGTVIEFLGDGIFVVFGAPKEMPGHAYTAVACAIEMQNAMEKVNAWNRDRGFPELEMGIGINSGVTAVGNIGSRKRMKYGCMGETVNLAGRLESFTVGGQIFVSGHTEKRIPEGLAADGEYSCMPKGAREEIKYYDVTGVGEKYRLRGRGGETTWNDVRESGPITFFEMDGKSVDMTRHEGRLTGISADEKYGVLEAGCILRPLQNLMIRIGGKDVYAKVLKAGEGSYRLCFTAKPESLRDLLAREARSPGGEESPQA